MLKKLTNPKLIVIFLIIFLALGLYFSLSQEDAAPAVTFTNLQGEKINLGDLKGKVVLVNFWATTCPGCVEEMPNFKQTYDQYHSKGFEMIAVAMRDDPPDQVLNFTKKNKLPFHIALDIDGRLAEAFHDVQLTPTTFLIDHDGHIVQQVIGQMDFTSLTKKLDVLLSLNNGKTQ